MADPLSLFGTGFALHLFEVGGEAAPTPSPNPRAVTLCAACAGPPHLCRCAATGCEALPIFPDQPPAPAGTERSNTQ